MPILFAAVLVPPIVEQLNNLIHNLPGVRRRPAATSSAENDTLRKLEEDYNITAELEKQASTLPARVGDAAGILSDIGLGLVNSIFAGVTILMLSLFMVGSRPPLARLVRRAPGRRSARRWLKRLFDRIGNAVGNYVAGALGQALVAGVLAYIVLLILGVPYAGSLAVVIFLLDLVPLVGATLGAILVGIITLFNDFPTDTIIWVDLVDRLPADREQRHPAAHPGRGRAGAPVRRARVGAVRLDAVRRPRRAAGDPGRGRDPDLDPRVQPPPPAREHRCGAGAARRRAAAGAPALTGDGRLYSYAALAARKSPTSAAIPPPRTKPGDRRADQDLLAALVDLLAPVGDLGDLGAQAVDRQPELGAVGLDRAPDLLRGAGRGHQRVTSAGASRAPTGPTGWAPARRSACP